MATQITQRDPSLPLQQDERQLMNRLFGSWADVPPTLKNELLDWLTVNLAPLLPIQQLQGFSQFTATPSLISTTEATSSSAYTNLATVGPEITGLAKGRYLFFFGCQLEIAAASDGGLMSLSYNAAAAADVDAIALVIPAATDTVTFASISRAVQKTFTTINNSVAARYRTPNAATCSFLNRWLISLRYGNA